MGPNGEQTINTIGKPQIDYVSGNGLKITNTILTFQQAKQKSRLVQNKSHGLYKTKVLAKQKDPVRAKKYLI